ncbi:MAG: hypothetical protein ACXWQO_13015, partial [Bdellovibrionota bacterium]
EGFSLRAGRFYPQYGLYDPNHSIVTRAGLGFDDDQESYNLEAAYLGTNADLFVTGIFGRPDVRSLVREKGVAVSSSVNIAEKNKIGVNVLRAGSTASSRWLTGLWGIVAISKKVFLLSEEDLQWTKAKTLGSASTTGAVAYQRLGYEPIQGFQVYGSHQLSYLNFRSLNSRQHAFGPGIDFFPRPHIELRAEYLREMIMAAGPKYFDYAWLMLHYYF